MNKFKDNVFHRYCDQCIFVLTDIRKELHVQKARCTYRNRHVRSTPSFPVDEESFLTESRLLLTDHNLPKLVRAECPLKFVRRSKLGKESTDPKSCLNVSQILYILTVSFELVTSPFDWACFWIDSHISTRKEAYNSDRNGITYSLYDTITIGCPRLNELLPRKWSFWTIKKFRYRKNWDQLTFFDTFCR